MLLIVGLGNPGRRYAGNRHNIGFMAVDEIHRRHRFSPWRARFEGETSEGELGGEKALLLKPATYMNESGRSVAQAMRFYKLAPADVVVDLRRARPAARQAPDEDRRRHRRPQGPEVDRGAYRQGLPPHAASASAIRARRSW